VAHDFRQHIRNININAEIVLTELGDSAGSHKWNLERISQVAKSMNQMTDDLLNYARMRNTPIHSSGVNLSNLAREFEEASRAAYPNTEFVYEEDLLVCGDQTMLRVVLENLLDNAFKYSQKAVHPKVELGRDDEGFFVRDNGIGFDEAYAEKLFLPFERLVLPTQFVGTGMGLANVKRILQRHGGRVWANSEPGKGATFHFTVQAP
jgi:signal transduction histidine kinase